MRNLNKLESLCLFVLTLFIAFSCVESADELDEEEVVSEAVLDQLTLAGFSPEGVFMSTFDGKFGYVVEGDLFFTPEQILELVPATEVPGSEQYRTSNLVRPLPRVIRVWLDPRLGTRVRKGTDRALSLFNDEMQSLTFTRVGDRNNADIDILPFREEPRGNLITRGMTNGFPTSSGNPASKVCVNVRWIQLASPSINTIRGLIMHEIGHCIGFRHTDFFNLSSCGQNINEGSAGVGAIHIPGTPTGTVSNSLMNACNSPNQASASDRVAFRTIY